jgi:hypothetical protein
LPSHRATRRWSMASVVRSYYLLSLPAPPSPRTLLLAFPRNISRAGADEGSMRGHSRFELQLHCPGRPCTQQGWWVLGRCPEGESDPVSIPPGFVHGLCGKPRRPPLGSVVTLILGTLGFPLPWAATDLPRRPRVMQGWWVPGACPAGKGSGFRSRLALPAACGGSPGGCCSGQGEHPAPGYPHGAVGGGLSWSLAGVLYVVISCVFQVFGFEPRHRSHRPFRVALGVGAQGPPQSRSYSDVLGAAIALYPSVCMCGWPSRIAGGQRLVFLLRMLWR